jgi:anaerobic selenocysteine-containing dehydrogenase
MAKDRVVTTVCGLCHTNCGMKISVKNGRIDKIRGDPDHPANSGALCIKGSATKELVYSPGRLRHPLRKTRGGFKQISWEEALDRIACKLSEIKDQYGPHTLLRFGGAPVTEAVRDAFVQLTAAYGSPNYANPGHLCSQPRKLGLDLVYGGRTDPDYNHTKCMLIWGANPTASMRPAERFTYGRFNRVIPEAKQRGAAVIVIDPRRIKTVRGADMFVQIKPGTDAALALAMLHVIIAEDLYDNEFVEKWTVGFAELACHVRPATPAWAEQITGVPAGTIGKLARTFAGAKPALIREGNGFDQHTNVVDSVRLTAVLTAITGNLDVPGGNVFYSMPKLAPCPTMKTEAKPLGSDRYPLYPRTFPPMIDAMLTGKPYQPRAMMVYHGNPALINANGNKIRQALEKIDFLVVSELFMTATAELADIVLPDTSAMERNGFQSYAGYNGGFLTPRQKVIDPIGESRPVLDVEYELARRLGLAHLYPWKNTDEWIDYKLKPSGISFSDLQSNPISYVTPPLTYRKYLQKGFATPSGKVEFYSGKLEGMGMNALPEYRAPEVAPTETYPLNGTTRRQGAYVHTQFRNLPSLRKREPEPLVRIHPQDAGPRGIEDGDFTIVESPGGSIRLKAGVTQEMQQGLVIIDFGWGNPGDGGVNVNILTSDEERDPFTAATPNRLFICEVKGERQSHVSARIAFAPVCTESHVRGRGRTAKGQK